MSDAQQSQGFTLVEVLVALFIFAIVGILSAASLHSMIRTHRQLKAADEQVLQEALTMTLLRRDLLEVIDRPVRDTDGHQEAALVGDGGAQLSFTRTGLFDPFDTTPQSNMQRVSYTLQGGDLVRLTWTVLDQPPHAEPAVQVLMHHVTSLHWQFLADNGSKSPSWPPTTGTNMQQETADLPKAVLMVMKVAGQGVMQGVFPVPAKGMKTDAPTA